MNMRRSHSLSSSAIYASVTFILVMVMSRSDSSFFMAAGEWFSYSSPMWLRIAYLCLSVSISVYLMPFILQ